MNNKNRIIYKIIIVLLCFSQNIFPQGNMNELELGTAIYRNMSPNHWHTGVFRCFEYLQSNNKGRMSVSQAHGWTEYTSTDYLDKTINISNYSADLSNLKSDFLGDKFDTYATNKEYQGAYSRTILPNTRSSIVATAKSVGDAHISWTWVDMLDPVNHAQWLPPFFHEEWDGSIGEIANLRCDGVVEYSYEKNGVWVANSNNIAASGNSHPSRHNDWHDCQWDFTGTGLEICPRRQAGEFCVPFCQENDTQFSSLQAADPIVNDFSRTQLSDKMQLNFKVGDNASVKAYVLVQVKKTNESTWFILKDENNNLWQFKEVDLTDWNGSIQSDNFHVPWNGRHNGGKFTSGNQSFDLKITVIDQGANYSDFTQTFSGYIYPIEVNISGPQMLDFKEKGTWTAIVTKGTGYHTYAWYKSFNGGSTWTGPIGSTNTFQTTMLFDDFLLRCDVADTQTNETDSDTHLVEYNDGMPKIAQEQEIEELPNYYALEANYPNPFNPTTKIKYQLKDDGFVSLIVYDILGKEVAELVNENKSAGFYNTNFDASNLSSGLYVYRLQVNGFVESKKMLLTK